MEVIRLTKQYLILTEVELLQMLTQNPGIWETALKRGKTQKRVENANNRKKAIKLKT